MNKNISNTVRFNFSFPLIDKVIVSSVIKNLRIFIKNRSMTVSTAKIEIA